MDDFSRRGIALLVLLLLLTGCAARGCTERRCHTPSGDGQTTPSADEKDAVILGRCHTACVEMLQLKTDESQLWPSVSTSTLEKNCDVFNEVMQCRLGCVTRANDSSITRGQCRSQCKDLCKAESCDDPRFCIDTTSSCEVTCRRSTCGTGCTLYTSSDALSSNDGLMVPPSPLDFPSLNQTESEPEKYLAGVFDIQYGFSETNVSSVNVTTGFVFKLERFGSNDTYYIFHTTLSEPLDLSYFACEGVSVSFAAVNAYGVSDYSPATEICVHGETFPSQVDRVYQEWIREDFRPGFFGRATINISWERPEGYEFLTHYVFLLLSPKDECGRRGVHTYEINRENTSFLLMAESPGDPPGFAPGRGCIYQTAIQSHPVLSTGNGERKTFAVDEVTDPPAPTLEVQCHRVVNETTGLIGIVARFRIITEEEDENSTTVLDLALEAIDHYEARLDVVELLEGNETQQVDIVFLHSFTVKNDTGANFYFTNNIFPRAFFNPSYYYSLMFKIHERMDLFWRGNASPQSCLVDASPLPPAAVSATSVSVFGLEFNGSSLFLNISWEAPEATHGTIVKYEIRVTSEPEMMDNQTGLELQPFLFSTEASTQIVVQEHEFYTTTEDPLCLYVQFRAVNNYSQIGEWSDPATLELYPNCTLPTDSYNNKDKLPVFVYAIIVAGVFASILVVSLIILTVVVCKKYCEGRELNKIFKDGNECDSMFDGFGKFAIIRPRTGIPPVSDDWEIPVQNVIVEDEIGEGCFGTVYKGIVKGPIYNCRALKTSFYVPVALKYLKERASGREREGFLEEIETLKKIAKANCPHIVSMVGCITIEEPLCLITEYLKYGDLLSYLRDIRKLITKRNRERRLAAEASYLELEGGVPLEQSVMPIPGTPYSDLGEVEPVNLISFAYQIASGMEYLASLEVAHRDLACRNILVGEDKKLKISDFGLSRVVEGDDVYVKKGNGNLPWKWMAIESIRNREFNTASDVWAFGVTLWEIATLGEHPYPSIPNGELLEYLNDGHRLERPENCSREMYEIMLDCWNASPDARPTFNCLRSKFDAILLEDNQYIQFSTITETDQSRYDRLSPLVQDTYANSSSSSMTIDNDNHSGYDVLEPEITGERLEHPLPRPVSNPYVQTPTRMPYEAQFKLEEIDANLLINEIENHGAPCGATGEDSIPTTPVQGFYTRIETPL